MIELRQQLAKERSVRMMLEEQVKRDTVLGLANATSGTTAWLAKKKGIYKVIFF